MKKLLLIAALMVSAFTVSAQLGQPVRLLSSATGEWYGAITNNTSCSATNSIIDTTKFKDVYVAWTSELSDAGTTANTLTLQQSADKVNWVAMTAFQVTPAGTTSKTVVTNLAVGAMPYMRVSSIANANANTGYITNYSVRVYLK